VCSSDLRRRQWAAVDSAYTSGRHGLWISPDMGGE
jgi:hypothetical protein